MKKLTLVLLIIFFILLRILPIWPNNFPYSYDNAKDSLIMFEMWHFKEPSLVGAITSIEGGLFQGPFWYYVLFPINFILGFHPFASVLTVVILGALTAWIFWKYLGKLEAFFFTTSVAVIATHQTSWSPYLAIFSTAWALVLLNLLKPKPNTLHLLLLSFSTSLLFHCEMAFGVPFVLLLILILILQKIRPNLKQIVLSMIVFLIPFTPLVIFDARHDLLQTKAVIKFIKDYSSGAAKVQENKSGLERVREVTYFFGISGFESISPLRISERPIHPIIPSASVAILLFILLRQKSLTKRAKTIIFPMIIGTFLIYLVLPVKLFYLVGLTPFWIFAFAQLLKIKAKKLIRPIVVIFTLIAIYQMIISKTTYETLSENSRILFAPKLEAVEAVYQLAQGQPFESFHFVPEIYDYTYQHIFQYTSIQKRRSLPVEYSYAPGEINYMIAKKILGPKTNPAFTMLIVEEDKNPQFFRAWWDKMISGKTILKMQKVNDSITVYKLNNEI